ncbi:acyl-CoA dehydrogenase family protein [Actinoplanes sp. CA-252034]|uniref:acyl-CoA dehydrogenase family protein n=1 Tax=Actinoplanes sp. CA-252034 TaxID=3239906 RepID=UPI003D95FBC5
MDHLLSPDEVAHHERLIRLTTEAWQDDAARWEEAGTLPDEVVRWCAAEGLLGAALPAEVGGGGWTAIRTGLLYEALGRTSASLASLVNVHGMMTQTLHRWGSDQHRATVLPPLAAGERVAAICMTEPHAGSDLAAVTTTLTGHDAPVLDGTKVYITFGGLADVFLVLAQRDGRPVGCLVDRKNPGLRVQPMGAVLGLRAAALARLEFRDCAVDPGAIVGADGFGLSVLVPHALEHGRHAVAWMAVGMLRAVFAACAAFALRRRAFDRPIVEYGQIQSILTRMGADLTAAEHLCVSASRALDAGTAEATNQVLTAKYFACRAAEEHTAQAVQLLGSSGVLESGVVARAYRDSKVLNIIEGTTQILERTLAPEYARAATRGR